MSDSSPELLVIGRIGGVYGVKGRVKIRSYTEPAENLFNYDNCRIQRHGQWQDIVLDAGKVHGKGLIAHIEGVDDRNDAEELKGLEISVPRADLPELTGDEYYWYQLEGLAVYAGQVLLGRIDHMLETGANDVMVVRACEGSLDKRERLLPWLRDSVVQSVNLAEGRVDVDWDPEF